MATKMKRFLAILMALTLCASLIAVPAMATETEEAAPAATEAAAPAPEAAPAPAAEAASVSEVVTPNVAPAAIEITMTAKSQSALWGSNWNGNQGNNQGNNWNGHQGSTPDENTAVDHIDINVNAGGTPENRKMLRSILEGSYNLLEAINIKQTLLLVEQNIDCIAAVLMDVTDPATDQSELLTQMQASTLFRDIPVIIIAPDDDRETLANAFGFGSADVIPIDYDQYAMIKRIENIVELSLHKRNLQELVQEQADILRHANDTMVDALSSIIEYRSVESGQHILRMRHFTRILLEEVARSCPEYGLTDRVIRIISSAAALHDVGKIATLHTKGAVNAIDRIIDAFPSTQQAQIRVQLAAVLRTVVSQQLLPDPHGGLVPACEIMQVNSAVRSLIRDNKNHQLMSVIASGGKEGMVSMDQSILSLYRAGKITRETALLHADNPEQLKRSL